MSFTLQNYQILYQIPLSIIIKRYQFLDNSFFRLFLYVNLVWLRILYSNLILLRRLPNCSYLAFKYKILYLLGPPRKDFCSFHGNSERLYQGLRKSSHRYSSHSSFSAFKAGIWQILLGYILTQQFLLLKIVVSLLSILYLDQQAMFLAKSVVILPRYMKYHYHLAEI